MTLFKRELIKSYTTLIFDLDGTVLDSMGVWADVDDAFLGKRGFSITEEYTNGIKCRSIYQGALFTIEMFNLNETPEAVIAEWEEMVATKYANTINLKSGVKDFIEYAHKEGLKICLATASSRKNSKAALERNGVLDKFDSLMTLDDFGSEVNKSNPDIYLKAMHEVGETDPSKCLVFEDVLGATMSAKTANFGTVIVYDELSKKDYEKAKQIADFAVETWKNV